MVASTSLKLIGYWSGPTALNWPDPRDFVDPTWDAEERDTVTQYLEEGFVFRAYGGISHCRFCEQPNGALERTDGEWYGRTDWLTTSRSTTYGCHRSSWTTFLLSSTASRTRSEKSSGGAPNVVFGGSNGGLDEAEFVRRSRGPARRRGAGG